MGNSNACSTNRGNAETTGTGRYSSSCSRYPRFSHNFPERTQPLIIIVEQSRGDISDSNMFDSLSTTGSDSHGNDEEPASDEDRPRRSKVLRATHKCHLCGKQFTRSYTLREHLRAHANERPFICTICGKQFTRSKDRLRHEALHSGDKPFMCKGDLRDDAEWGCGRRFPRVDSLRTHLRSARGRACIKPLSDQMADVPGRIESEEVVQWILGGQRLSMLVCLRNCSIR
jgi:hypothetical protein